MDKKIKNSEIDEHAIYILRWWGSQAIKYFFSEYFSNIAKCLRAPDCYDYKRKKKTISVGYEIKRGKIDDKSVGEKNS